VAFRLTPFQGNIRIKEERCSLFEGWFVNYVRSMGASNHLFDKMNYWAPTSSKVEVDLILTRNKDRIAIEIIPIQKFLDDDSINRL